MNECIEVSREIFDELVINAIGVLGVLLQSPVFYWMVLWPSAKPVKIKEARHET